MLPGLSGFDQFGPEGEQTALRGFGGVDRAAIWQEEVALTAAGLAKAEQMAGAIQIALFEHCGGEAEETSGAEEVGFGEIDESLDIAAAGTAGLAGETEARFAGRSCGASHLRFILNNERRSFKGKQDTNDMPAREDGEYELILGNKQLLGVLFIVIVLLGVFFAMGFLAGRSTTPTVATTAPSGGLKTIDPPVEPGQSVAAAGPAETAQAEIPPVAKVEPPPPVKAEVKLPEVKPTAPPVTLQGGAETATNTAALTAPAAGSYLQVAATSLKDGQGMLGLLKRNGHAGTLMAVPNQSGLVRVLVGPLAGKEAVAAARDKLRELGIDSPMPRTIQ